MNKADHEDGHQHTDPGSSCCSCHCSQPTPLSQDLDELEFERSILGAAARGSAKQTAALIKRGRHKDRDARGYNALHFAARAGSEDVVRLLLQTGDLNVNETTRAGHATPLHRAAYIGHTGIIKLLLQAGADRSIQDADGYTAYQKAAINGHDEAALFLSG